jgi:hypothetical protein
MIFVRGVVNKRKQGLVASMPPARNSLAGLLVYCGQDFLIGRKARADLSHDGGCGATCAIARPTRRTRLRAKGGRL